MVGKRGGKGLKEGRGIRKGEGRVKNGKREWLVKGAGRIKV